MSDDDQGPCSAHREEVLLRFPRAIILMTFMSTEAIAKTLGIAEDDALDLKEQAHADFWALKVAGRRASRP